MLTNQHWTSCLCSRHKYRIYPLRPVLAGCLASTRSPSPDRISADYKLEREGFGPSNSRSIVTIYAARACIALCYRVYVFSSPLAFSLFLLHPFVGTTHPLQCPSRSRLFLWSVQCHVITNNVSRCYSQRLTTVSSTLGATKTVR